MEYTQYIKAELLVLVPVLYAVGQMLKGTELIKDKYIPLILTVLGVILACVYVCVTDGIGAMSFFTAFVQGVLVSASTVYAKNVIKQSKEG